MNISITWWQGCWTTRRGFQGSFSANNDVDQFDPEQITPTLAMKSTPSRFPLKPNVNENIQELLILLNFTSTVKPFQELTTPKITSEPCSGQLWGCFVS